MPTALPTSQIRSDTPTRRGRCRLVAGAAVVLLAAGACGARPGAPIGAGGSAPSAATVGGLTSMTLGVDPSLADEPFDTARQVLAPTGWTVSVFARVEAARLLAWAPDGKLLVSRPKLGDVIALDPAGSDGAPTPSTLLSGLNQPHGLAFAGPSTLYVAQSDRVDAYAYGDGVASVPRTVVDGLPDAKSPELKGAYAHALKSVTVGPDGAVYVSVGSTGNVSVADRSADPERATIMRVPPGGGQAEVFARGVRNGTGLAVDPDGAVWTAVNNRDQVAYPEDRDIDGDGRSDRGQVVTSYVNDHPLEPLARLTQGRDLGWPYCNPDPDLDPGAPGSALSYTDRPFVRDVQTNADGSKLDCGSLPPVEQGLGAHSAPLGLSFATSPGLPQPYGPGALVGVHGSWNRHPPRAPEVSFFPWRDGTLGPQQTLLGGFQDAAGDRWGRPVMAVQGPDDAVYVSDDLAGAIYRMAPPA
ncbi:MAG: PQQ-dependent sugar dehydrogenase [Propionibacteriaceae bacterium]